MCPACADEYNDPYDRRFHAEAICCGACGPRLRLLERTGREIGGNPMRGAAERLRQGFVVAVKGVGGYHLAAAAANDAAVTSLRSRKHRHYKPFAVMVATSRAGTSSRNSAGPRSEA
jgi:hydrogenase maturation protein HypF